MLLQTNSYIVPPEKRAAHNNLMKRFRQVLARIGCDHFEVYEQVGTNWSGGDTNGRFVQIMKFRDRKHCQSVQAAERQDPAAQSLVKEFCDLINLPYQTENGLFAHGYYASITDPIKLRGQVESNEVAEEAAENFDPEDTAAQVVPHPKDV
jgi:hypothetical protein